MELPFSSISHGDVHALALARSAPALYRSFRVHRTDTESARFSRASIASTSMASVMGFGEVCWAARVRGNAASMDSKTHRQPAVRFKSRFGIEAIDGTGLGLTALPR